MATKQVLAPVIDPGTLQMTVQAQPVEHGQTWTTHVLVPLTQNICGGVALGVLGFIAFVTLSEWQQRVWHATDIFLWCLLAGGTMTCLMTLIRFFSDDVGIIGQAYKAGQRSMLPRISALETNLQAATDALQNREVHTSEESRLLEVLARARTDAERLIRLHFEGEKIDRKRMTARGMGQRDWERARRLLQAAGIVHGDGHFAIKTPAEALQQLNQRVTADGRHKSKGRTFMPAWH